MRPKRGRSAVRCLLPGPFSARFGAKTAKMPIFIAFRRGTGRLLFWDHLRDNSSVWQALAVRLYCTLVFRVRERYHSLMMSLKKTPFETPCFDIFLKTRNCSV